jgi:hypothetical protein
MKSLILLLSVFLAGGAAAKSCGPKGNNNASGNSSSNSSAGNYNAGATPTPTPSDEIAGAELKVLAEGQGAKADQPFVAVVRDAETYAALGALAGELPPVDAETFRTHAVVAAFLGYRNTGGYSVSIRALPGGVLGVAESAPPPGSITTQVITNPFKVVSVAEAEQSPVTLELGEGWKKWETSYVVTDGDFASTGGIAGRSEKFRLKGDISTSALGKLRTFRLNLTGEGASRPRSLRTTTTGLLTSSSTYDLPHFLSGTLVEKPNSGLRATAQLDLKNTVLLLTFEPNPPEVADGFGGQGRLRAQAGRAAR